MPVSPTTDADSRPGDAGLLPGNTARASQPAALLSVNDVAAMLSCSSRHLRRLLDAGAMPPAIRLGNLVRFRRDQIVAWIQSGCPKSR